jgi:ribosomal protein S16
MKHFLFFFLTGYFVSANAVCCSCTSDYSAIASQLASLTSEVNLLTSTQEEETAKLKKFAIRQGAILATEKRRAEMIAQAKAIDSVGFSQVIARYKAERIGLDSKRMEVMAEGYQVSEEDVQAILKSME